MRLIHFESSHGNFGDDLNPWLWSKLLPGLVDGKNDGVVLLGIGTILNEDLIGEEVARASKIHVLGSGCGYGTLPSIDDRWVFHCVRGPHTARALGLNTELAVSDPAILVRLLVNKKIDKKYDVSFMPHVGSVLDALAIRGRTVWEWICRLNGVQYIDPRDHFSKTLDTIRQSRLLITEAMHGAIVADTFRVPWIPIRFHKHILEFKWRDWCASVGLDYKPITLHTLIDLRPSSEAPFFERLQRKIMPLSYAFDLPKLVEQTDPFLSEQQVLEENLGRLQSILQTLLD